MSHSARQVVEGHIGELGELLQTVPEKRRPNYHKAAFTALWLAGKYRDDRHYVDETISQLCAVVMVSESSMKHILRALHEIAWFVSIGQGNQHHGSRRGLGVSLGGDLKPDGPLRQPDLPKQNEGAKTGTTPVDKRAKTGNGGAKTGTTPELRQVDLPTPQVPNTPPVVNKSSNRFKRDDDEEDQQLAETWIAAHIERNGHRMDSPGAVANKIRPQILGVIRRARAYGVDPGYELNETWPVRDRWAIDTSSPDPPAADYDQEPVTAVTACREKLATYPAKEPA